jgi:tRNA G18 (ribose-2'-O)-methylase SpoU
VITRCPFLDCHHQFEVPEGSRYADCPGCLRSANVRSLEHVTYLNRQIEWRQEQNSLSGGAKRPSAPETLTVLLEDVRSLWNVGSIFRTADGAGFSRLFLVGITGAPPRKEIAKTSLGAEDNVAWEFHRSAQEVLPGLKASGVTIVGLERNNDSVPLSGAFANGMKGPLCLVLGNEVTGVSRETLSLCDMVCDLPMRGMKESLNVAVAFGIAAYAIAECVLPEDSATRLRKDDCEETRSVHSRP